ncbi:hypothetical protein UNH65_27990 [Chitinophaga sp. 180180018-2]|nr:hypothetical protein [Chitinophaga sp. 212800010-3]
MKLTLKGLYLSVPTPCEENWSDMVPTAMGRHCNTCNQAIVDFSLMSDAEIFAVISNSEGMLPGPFQEDLSGRCIPAPAIAVRRARLVAT